MTHDSSDSPFVQIALINNETTIVSPEDADLAKFRWYRTGGGKYVKSHQCTPALMHRVVIERVLGRSLVEGEYVDHINGDVSNNTRDNLRVASKRQNGRNRKVNGNSKSGYKGVSFYARSKAWRACITLNGKGKTLGYYATPEDAARAYDLAALEHFGEFARLNDLPSHQDKIPQKISLPIGRPSKK